MRLTQYLNEETIGTVIAKLQRECSQIIKVYQQNNAYFFRGINGNPEFAVKKAMHPDRNPKDTPLYFHTWMNEWFQQHFGWLVRNGISATPIAFQARDYGALHMFFPKNGFQYVWNPIVGDVTQIMPNDDWASTWRKLEGAALDNKKLQKDDFNKFLTYIANTPHPDLKKVIEIWNFLDPTEVEFFEDRINSIINVWHNFFFKYFVKYTDKDLKKALLVRKLNKKFSAEVMFNSPTYYLINLDYPMLERDVLYETIENGFNFTKGSIEKWIK